MQNAGTSVLAGHWCHIHLVRSLLDEARQGTLIHQRTVEKIEVLHLFRFYAYTQTHVYIYILSTCYKWWKHDITYNYHSASWRHGPSKCCHLHPFTIKQTCYPINTPSWGSSKLDMGWDGKYEQGNINDWRLLRWDLPFPNCSLSSQWHLPVTKCRSPVLLAIDFLTGGCRPGSSQVKVIHFAGRKRKAYLHNFHGLVCKTTA